MANAKPAPDQIEPRSHLAASGQGLLGLAFRLYKSLLSPVIHTIAPSRCLYLPTCSEYAYTAISRFGVTHGSWLAIRRVGRCHPWAKGGLDPVPDNSRNAKSRSTGTDSSVPHHDGVDHLS